ncbi:MAG TPA: hypothetical protein PK328_00545 [Chitinophagaceae bacterium]|nr:hypothetical protein [Chitinophagaceae bacterium]
MKAICSVLLIVFIPLMGISQTILGTELYIQLDKYYYTGDSFVCKFFDNEAKYSIVAKRFSLTPEESKEDFKIFSVDKRLDTTWFSRKNNKFFIDIFKKNDRHFIKSSDSCFEIPEYFLKRSGNFTKLNLYLNKDYQNYKITLASFVRMGDVYKPKINILFKKGRQKIIKSCPHGKVNLILEQESWLLPSDKLSEL